jgi:CMP/dCMP kinase
VVDADQRLIVTIDGPAGTGKSAVSHRLAAELGISCLDTGAMYRCVALMTMREGIDASDASLVMPAMDAHPIDFDWTQHPPMPRLDGEPVGEAIRSAEIGRVVSIVAAVPEIRGAMVQAQRRIAQTHPRLVSEGRDQGSVVFPDAEARFYLTADASIRAHRRARQLRATGHENVEEAEVLQAIEARDALDRSRKIGPLTCAPGAILIDTTEMGRQEVVERLAREVRAIVDGAVSGSC